MIDSCISAWKQRDNIWAKTAILLAVLLLFGGLLSHYLQSQYEKVLQTKQDSLERVVNNLELRLGGSLTAVQLLAADLNVSETYFNETKKKLDKAVVTLGLQNAALFDVEGNLLADAAGNHPVKIYDFSSYKKALSGQPNISNRIVPGALDSAYISVRAPVYDQERRIAAVVAAAIPIADLSVLVDRENFSDGQYIFILDKNGQFIHHPRLKSVFPENTDYFSHVFPVADGKTVIIKKKSILDDIDKIYIYQPLKNTEWRITYAAPVRVVYLETLVSAGPDIFVSCLLIGMIVLILRYLREAGRNSETMELVKMERLSAATQMAAGIAHEVRNPLTSIKGFIQLMMKKEDKTNFNNYLEIVLGEIERIDALIGEFQLLARPLRQPMLAKTDLSKIVSDVVLLMESQAEMKQVKLEYLAQGELFNESGIWIQADVSQIKQVLINLIRNACEAVPVGGKIHIAITRRQEMPALVIEDNGPGMSPDVIKKIGTPFFTTKEGGTGLGLSVCYAIIHNHGGKISVESSEGAGTAFTILFPPHKEAKS